MNNNSNRNLGESLNKNKKKLQWLAGLIDGDGCFSISKKGYACLEITVSLIDENVVQQINSYLVVPLNQEAHTRPCVTGCIISLV